MGRKAGACPRPNLKSTCEIHVLLLSTYLSGWAHQACRCGLEDTVSCNLQIKPQKHCRVEHSTGASVTDCSAIYPATPFCQGAAVSCVNGSCRLSLCPRS